MSKSVPVPILPGATFCLIAAGVAAAAPPLIVPTDPLSPEQQREAFHLPPGFEIELIASDPDIGQPMNLNFDAAGRLWVTHSVEYPYPVAGEGVEPRDERFGPSGEPPARDRVSVISGIGTEDVRVTHFAEGLNIPIGIVPLSTKAAIGYSIPNVVRWDLSNEAPRLLQSSRGAGATERPTSSVLLGPFGNVDTHGMINGLTHWIDGWVYACHGFRNTSTVSGTDGHEITMNSGNTFRFRPDGSRVEQFTWGQVNPYGLTFDPWGNIYTADCHSMPLTCLIPGAHYPSFGKPHDGLGFGPNMIDHSHGSTGICGPCYYAADQFPEDYRDCLYLCNPVTGIVHRDKLIWHGSTPRVDTQPDFITCDDGWFRPVDIQLGPDGALYIADFYNAVIGHYEVPLDNPQRDRTHGRIWRVTYPGDENPSGANRSTGFQPVRDGRQQSASDASDTANEVQPKGTHGLETRATTTMPDLTSESLDELIARLGDPNLTVRVLASHEITERFPQQALDPLRTVLRETESAEQCAHALWLVERLDRLTADDIAAVRTIASPLPRMHLLRCLGERSEWNSHEAMEVYIGMLHDGRLIRAGAEAFARHPGDILMEFSDLLKNIDEADTHARHAVRVAMRNAVAKPGVLDRYVRNWRLHRDEIASVCLAVPTEGAAQYVTAVLKKRLIPSSYARRRADGEEPTFSAPKHLLPWVTLVAAHAQTDLRRELIDTAKDSWPQEWLWQTKLILAIHAGLKGESSRDPLFQEWATDVATALIRQINPKSLIVWNPFELSGASAAAADWRAEVRTAVDGQPTRLWSSLPGGEQGVGVFRSPSFALPERISFWIAGHDGFPNNDAAGKNLVRLVSDADGHTLRSVPVPRQDSPVQVKWKLDGESRQKVHVELVDGLDLNAYAWTAAGRFSINSLNPPEYVPSELAAELIGTLKLQALRPEVEQLIADAETPPAAVHDLASAHLQLQPDVRLEALLPWLETSPSSSVARQVRVQLIQRDPDVVGELLTEAMRSASSGRQQAMAAVLAGRLEGARQLVELVTAGHASPRLLARRAILVKLNAVVGEPLRAQIVALIRDLPPADERLAKLIGERRASFDPRAASVERGREVFKKSCAVCHQIGGEGKKVGPQLDGIGLRGVDRLLEDTLDPNRNVDAAFRSTTLLTNDGRVLTGLLRHEEGDALVLADTKGEEFRVAVGDVEERSLSPLSLMPEDQAEKLPLGDLHDLLAFLLAQTQKRPQ